MPKYCHLFLALIASVSLYAQNQIMDESVYTEWKRTSNISISDNGEWISYQEVPGWGNKTLKLYQVASGNTYSFSRAEIPEFSSDGNYLSFKITHDKTDLKDLKRKNTKKEDLPKDTLAIYYLEEQRLQKTPNLKSYKVPEKYASHIAMQYDQEEDNILYNKKKLTKTVFI